jgi:WD40 repeat protein
VPDLVAARLPSSPLFHAWATGAPVNAATWTADGAYAAFALGDGSVRFAPKTLDKKTPLGAVAVVPEGAVFSVAPLGSFVAAGTDAGTLARVAPGAAPEVLLNTRGMWVEHVAALPKADGVLAAAGKDVFFIAADGTPVRTLGPHPKTVDGLNVRADGQVLAVAHYGGVTLWHLADPTAEPRRLDWKGAHLCAAQSPSGAWLVTGMPDPELHLWRLEDGSDLRMGGYMAKIYSLSWTVDGAFLATSGADVTVVWPFVGHEPPVGKEPILLGFKDGTPVTRVACHPHATFVASGYADGTVLLLDILSAETRPEGVQLKRPGNGAVTALAWSPDGMQLAVGTAEGFVGVFDFMTAAKA